MRPPEELLYESEASLRLVDHAIEELGTSETDLDLDARLLLEQVLAHPGGIDRLKQMHGRLCEVSSATETAATDMLDGLRRTIHLLEQLDVAAAVTDADRHRMIASVRDELSGVMNHLQFQDITSQQLGHIASLLADMRGRINQIVTIFAQPDMPVIANDAAPGTFDPNATTTPSGDRQAVADEIFAMRAERKTA